MHGWEAVAVLSSILCAVQCRQYTLNVPRVLLPIVPASGVKANFTLKSQAGCFTWKSTKPDVASVRPLYTNGEKQGGGAWCSREALLTPQSSEQTRLSTVIIAEEQTTGQTLRCDVFVDTVHRVEITTRTRELLLEEEPERFEILGFDEEGNTFSTLRGHRFDWLLLRDEEATHQTTEPEAILHFVRFDDSSYSTDPIIGGLEANGYHGDTVLVEGGSTGTAKVSVRFVDRVWKDVVSPATVKLLVIENIMLQPAMDVYILPFCTVHYTVERKKQGKTEVVAMPSEQYSLELTNTTVASLDVQTSNVTGLVIGDTEIVLQDKNMLHTPSATKPTAGIHVVPPHHLGYTILPDNVWVLEVGREYQITVHVFDKFNHPVLVTEVLIHYRTKCGCLICCVTLECCDGYCPPHLPPQPPHILTQWVLSRGYCGDCREGHHPCHSVCCEASSKWGPPQADSSCGKRSVPRDLSTNQIAASSSCHPVGPSH